MGAGKGHCGQSIGAGNEHNKQEGQVQGPEMDGATTSGGTGPKAQVAVISPRQGAAWLEELGTVPHPTSPLVARVVGGGMAAFCFEHSPSCLVKTNMGC